MQHAMGRISLLEIESVDREGGQLREGPITLVLGMVKAFGKLQVAVVLALDHALWFPARFS